MQTPYTAAQVYHDTRGLSAFNVPKEGVTRVTRNQFGARYTFRDGTALFIARDLMMKWFHQDGTCLAARIGPGYR
jgi:hypothetical protein